MNIKIDEENKVFEIEDKELDYQELSESSNYKIRRWVAWNQNTPSSILDSLVFDDDEKVISLLIDNLNTSFETFNKIVKLNNEEHSLHISSLFRTSPKAMEMLSKHKNEKIRLNVASNPNTPSNVLLSMINDTNEDVLNSLVQNPNLPVLELIEDNDFTKQAKSILIDFSKANELSDLVDLEYSYYYIARNPYTKFSILENLLQLDDEYTRYGLTLNPNIPFYILDELSKITNDSLLKVLIIENKNVSKNTLEFLSKDTLDFISLKAKNKLLTK